MKVNLMIIGAQKCATTSLFNILARHSLIDGARIKEPNFFSKPRVPNELKGYHDLFTNLSASYWLEASTSYTFYPRWKLDIWSTIYEYNQSVKLIYLVRKPVDRIISNYMHSYETGYTSLGLEDALKYERRFVDNTRYYTQIKPYIDLFGRDNVLIIDFADFTFDQKATILKIEKFLDLQHDASILSAGQNVKANISIGGTKLHHKFNSPSLPLRVVRRFSPFLWSKITDNSSRSFPHKPVLTPELKEMIFRMLELEVRGLEPLINKDLSSWLTD